MSIRSIAAAGAVLLLLSVGACATTEAEVAAPMPAAVAPAPAPAPAPTPDPAVLAIGEGVFNTRCAGCHVRGSAPKQDTLATHTHAQVVAALTTGKMMAQGRALTVEQRSAVATFLTGEVG